MKILMFLLSIPLIWLAWKLFRAAQLAFDDAMDWYDLAEYEFLKRMRAKFPTLTAPVSQLVARGIRKLFR